MQPNRQGPRGFQRDPWQTASQASRQSVGIADSGKPILNRNQPGRVARVEAALWLAEEPLSLSKIVKAAGLDGAAEAKKLIQQLKENLARRSSALEVIEVAGGIRLTTRPCFSPWLSQLLPEGPSDHSKVKLTAASEETLTVVAYRQPVLRAEIESIRGVGCGDVLRQLMEADLLRIVGRSEELGRPLLYGTTARFLEVYGLGSLADLPRCDEGTDSAGPTKNNATHDRAA